MYSQLLNRPTVAVHWIVILLTYVAPPFTNRIAAATVDSFELFLRVSATAITNGDPVYCQISLRNRTTEQVRLRSPWMAARRNVWLEVRVDDLHWERLKSADEQREAPRGGVGPSILAGESYSTIPILWVTRTIEIGAIDKMQIRACTRLEGPTSQVLSSLPVEIDVKGAALHSIPKNAFTVSVRPRFLQPYQQYMESIEPGVLQNQLRWRLEFKQWYDAVKAHDNRECVLRVQKWNREMDPVTWQVFQFGIARVLSEEYFCEAAEAWLKALPRTSELTDIVADNVDRARGAKLCREAPAELFPLQQSEK